MFGSVLVANRGEIACRVFRTARRMGLTCFAVHSEADARARHVREADASALLGPGPANESYLRADRVLEAARALGAEAIHPGYGFLSENPEFAEAVIAAGLVWVGPTPAAIRAMGLKDESKRIAEEAGVPVLPGYRGADQSEKRLLAAAKEIGFPVLIKAVAGGGGRGIREVRSAEEFKDALASAQRESKAAFGDDRVLVEKLVEQPRHIEVQVFGDKHGEVVHLFERDCSLQRRRQKVIEEAPAPGMTEAVRAAMTEAAVKVARAVGYQNAGTVEFIVDGAGPLRPDGFWFLEMNTRLQVEHPVTEAVTGLDLVEWQLRVAAGERLPLRQEQIRLCGHAIEARVCAEDPAEGFRPSVGRLARVRWPTAHARTDSGFEQGDTVSPFYDSLLAKVIVEQPDRGAAITALEGQLDHVEVGGLRANAGYLRRCLGMAAFRSGAVHTALLGQEHATLTDTAALRRSALALLGASLLRSGGGTGPWGVLDGWRNAAPARIAFVFEDARGRETLTIRVAGEVLLVDFGGETVRVERLSVESSGIAALVGGFAMTASVHESALGWSVHLQGETFEVWTPGARADLADLDAEDDLKSPLPGKVVAIAGAAGQKVSKGDVLAVIEAMKMEHALKSPRDGVVAAVLATEGAQVAEGAVLVRLEPMEG